MRRARPGAAIVARPAAVLALGLALSLGCGPAAAGAAEPSSPSGAAVSAEASAQEGGVRAVLTYREGLGGPLPYFDLKLAITSSGIPAYEQPVSSHRCPSGCEPETLEISQSKGSPVAVTDLEGNGQADVVLELSTGGAHCCAVVQVLTYDPGTMAYLLAEHDFGDPGALLRTIEGDPHPVFESGDDRFAYEFGSYADSAFPLEVLGFQQGRFVNVTRSFPKQIAAQAASLFKGFREGRRRGEGLGALAAWAADEELLGRGILVTQTLKREARLHNLRSDEGQSAAGRAFVAKLERFLKSTGYT
jgi:hypothetical protein